MNLYLLSQNVNNDYDTYDCAIVCAKNKSDALTIHPDRSEKEFKEETERTYFRTWVGKKSDIHCKLIGIASPRIKRGVVCASFNAG